MEDLDKTERGELRHAYGAATDVPAQLREGAAQEDDRRESASWFERRRG